MTSESALREEDGSPDPSSSVSFPSGPSGGPVDRETTTAIIRAAGFEWLDLSRPLTDDDRERLRASGLKVPTHIAVIMDGNGRWAKQRGLPRSLGHRAGAEQLRVVTEAAARLGVGYLTVYAFSTENWQRPNDEVNQLMKLFVEFFHKYDAELAKEDIRVRFTGALDELPEDVRSTIDEATASSTGRRGMQLIVAFNYGGRREILDAVTAREEALRSAWEKGETLPPPDEASFRRYLYLPDVPDPDLLIRSSGEMRTSNFLLWEAAYSELWVSRVLWPDFAGPDLLAAVIDYHGRNRRFGKVSAT